jgi:hypothetical protein
VGICGEGVGVGGGMVEVEGRRICVLDGARAGIPTTGLW